MGSGSLSISNGLTLTSTGGILGCKAGSDGTGAVNGAGTTWTSTSGLAIGTSGSGSLAITNGAGLNLGSTNLTIAFGATATGTLSLSGSSGPSAPSSATCGQTYLGVSGNATLNLTNGGTLTGNGNTYVGQNADATGLANIRGAGSTWTLCQSAFVGDLGSGTVNVTNGGAVITGGSTPGSGYTASLGFGATRPAWALSTARDPPGPQMAINSQRLPPSALPGR